MKIGQAVKTLRQRKNLSQMELASKVDVTQGFLSLIEKNDREPNFDLIKRIAKALEVPEQLIFLLSCEQTSRQRRYSKPLHNIALALDDLLNAFSPKS